MIHKGIGRSKFLIETIVVVCCLWTTMLMASQEKNEKVDIEALIEDIDRLEQALYEIENVQSEEPKPDLQKPVTPLQTNVSAEKKVNSNEVTIHYKSSETTEQDKLIADMAERMNDNYGLSNQDNSVIIGGVALNHQDKLVLKNFVEGIRDQLAKITGLKFPSSAYRIMIYGAVPKTDYGSENKSKYKINIVPDAIPYHDVATIRITILHPAAMDSHEFAENVIRGYLALYTHVMRNDNYAGENTELPKWFIKGLAKQIDFSSKYEDINDALYFWSKGLVPPIETLLTEDSTLIQSNSALGTALVGYWLDLGVSGDSMKQLFTKLANGTKWSSELYRETARKTISFSELNRGFDYWMLAQRFKVLKVGSSSEGLAKRIVTHLSFIPKNSMLSKMNQCGWVALPAVDLVKYKSELWAKKTAEKKTRFLTTVSAGRNDEFRAAISELVVFYQGIIDGEASEDELREKYNVAEEMLFNAVTKERE